MRREDYKFMSIVDAMNSINQRVNLVGIVVESSLPKTTKGTDFFGTVKIIDHSRPKQGIFVNFFADTMEKLPNVHAVGDIVLLSSVLVKARGAEVYVSFEKKSSSFALFDGRDSDSDNDIMPYQTSPRYDTGKRYNRSILRLRKLLQQIKVESLHEALIFPEIMEGEHLNLLCKILHSREFEGHWIVYVWNGTDTPPASVKSNLEDELKNPLPLELDPSPLSRETLLTFPTVGTVLRMIFDQGTGKLGISLLREDTWAILVNINCKLRDALWFAEMTPFSKICYLHSDDARVVELEKRFYGERVPSKRNRAAYDSFPFPSFVTETEHPDVPFSTLMDILTSPKVVHKYKCVVRVVSQVPLKVTDLRAPNGIYRVRLTLEDPTARIHAYIFAEDGEKFYGRFETVHELTKANNSLLGITDEPEMFIQGGLARKPPWIQCCIYSYYTDEANVSRSKAFRIFDTILLGDD